MAVKRKNPDITQAIPASYIDCVKTNVEKFKRTFNMKIDGHAFAAWFLSYRHELSDDDGVNYTTTLAKGDKGIDGWYYETESSNDFYLYQSKFPDTANHVEGIKIFDELLNGYDVLSNSPLSNIKNEKLKVIM